MQCSEKEDSRLRVEGDLVILSIDKVDILQFHLRLFKGIPLNQIGKRIEELLAEEPEWLKD